MAITEAFSYGAPGVGNAGQCHTRRQSNTRKMGSLFPSATSMRWWRQRRACWMMLTCAERSVARRFAIIPSGLLSRRTCSASASFGRGRGHIDAPLRPIEAAQPNAPDHTGRRRCALVRSAVLLLILQRSSTSGTEMQRCKAKPCSNALRRYHTRGGSLLPSQASTCCQCPRADLTQWQAMVMFSVGGGRFASVGTKLRPVVQSSTSRTGYINTKLCRSLP